MYLCSTLDLFEFYFLINNYLLAVHGNESPFFLGRASVNSTVNVEIFALIPVGDYRETSARGRVVLRMMNV